MVFRIIKYFTRKTILFLKNLIRLIKLSPKILRDGGHLSINVSTIKYDKILKNKNILITGGSSGIGLSIAKKALELGANVIITGRNKKKLDIAKINNKDLLILEWDISKIDELPEKIKVVNSFFKDGLDILVNNAGIVSKKLFPNVSSDEWDSIYNTNSKGLFFLTQAISNQWLKQLNTNVKKIINISSQGGFVGATYPYRLSKWDVVGLTKGLALELSKNNIIVNGIAPGIIKTKMQKNLIKSGNNYCKLNPQKRLAMPEEISELAVFLMSDASNFITGQTIICDGGYSLK